MGCARLAVRSRARRVRMLVDGGDATRRGAAPERSGASGRTRRPSQALAHRHRRTGAADPRRQRREQGRPLLPRLGWVLGRGRGLARRQWVSGRAGRDPRDRADAHPGRRRHQVHREDRGDRRGPRQARCLLAHRLPPGRLGPGGGVRRVSSVDDADGQRRERHERRLPALLSKEPRASAGLSELLGRREGSRRSPSPGRLRRDVRRRGQAVRRRSPCPRL